MLTYLGTLWHILTVLLVCVFVLISEDLITFLWSVYLK